MSERLLEERDAGDAGGSGGQASGGVLWGDAAEREDGEAHGLASLPQAVQAQRLAVGRLGRGEEDRAEDRKIGALALGRAELVERMAGDADQETGRRDGSQPAGRDGAGGQVDAMGPGGQSEIQAGVDQDLGPMGIGESENGAQEFEEFAGREVLFTNLEHLDAGGEVSGEDGEQRGAASQGLAAGDVVADHFSRQAR